MVWTLTHGRHFMGPSRAEWYGGIGSWRLQGTSIVDFMRTASAFFKDIHKSDLRVEQRSGEPSRLSRGAASHSGLWQIRGERWLPRRVPIGLDTCRDAPDFAQDVAGASRKIKRHDL